jgi:hypothetical protein
MRGLNALPSIALQGRVTQGYLSAAVASRRGRTLLPSTGLTGGLRVTRSGHLRAQIARHFHLADLHRIAPDDRRLHSDAMEKAGFDTPTDRPQAMKP